MGTLGIGWVGGGAGGGAWAAEERLRWDRDVEGRKEDGGGADEDEDEEGPGSMRERGCQSPA